ncbi:hypothetical protein VNO77_18196 [Canavalia gladiata]|uniref:Uncharacterized protein n=1 Tax=Canavalia gladiata TaxID=3824 RepID=A0AAN9LQC2_CANGL
MALPPEPHRLPRHLHVPRQHFYFHVFDAYCHFYDPSTRPEVTDILQQASNQGLTVARSWAFSDGGVSRAIQLSRFL